MGHKVPQSQYFHGLWHSFFFSTVKDGILAHTYFKVKIRPFFSFISTKYNKMNKKIFIALDVFKDEPNLNPDLFSLRNAVFTNHVAGKTPEGEQGIGNDLFMQVNNIFY